MQAWEDVTRRTTFSESLSFFMNTLTAFTAALGNEVRGFGVLDPHFNPEGHRSIWESSRGAMPALLETGFLQPMRQ